MFQAKVTIHSAHIATYGERAIDVFYITDLIGDKIEPTARMRTLERLLLEAAGGEAEEESNKGKNKKAAA